jgi:CheY-like chemotaxis protein
MPPPAGNVLDGDTDLNASLASRPVVVYGDGGEAADRWDGFARRGVVREARTPARLLDQASFFLHRTPAKMPEMHRDALRELYEADDVLRGRNVMVVDDDMRNIFALTSLLEDRGMNVISHDNGRDAITSLRERQDVDVVLMDIMMPEMDGIDTIREIRRIPECRDVPIIAVTAKAMKGDREKCMEAGAWDYLAKPVDTELMVGTLRAWLRR